MVIVLLLSLGSASETRSSRGWWYPNVGALLGAVGTFAAVLAYEYADHPTSMNLLGMTAMFSVVPGALIGRLVGEIVRIIKNRKP